jgi:hypothetical protein
MALASRSSSTVHLSTTVRRVLVVCCLLMTAPATAADSVASNTGELIETRRVQALVDEFRQQLNLPPAVTASIVPENPLLVSVSPPHDGSGAYGLSFEAGFLDTLSDDDLRAVVAHELGHVWIFTHHPYLQTEALANQIAQRLVTRQSLERVYSKVWQQGVPKGTVSRFSDAPPDAAIEPAGTQK